ncbi:hypothetical protein C2E23DRAFT_810271 [Lenzites betulinus]|nr:hypothetical protein C2E23DRAFT_810271 [Lenzites betulinus]
MPYVRECESTGRRRGELVGERVNSHGLVAHVPCTTSRVQSCCHHTRSGGRASIPIPLPPGTSRTLQAIRNPYSTTCTPQASQEPSVRAPRSTALPILKSPIPPQWPRTTSKPREATHPRPYVKPAPRSPVPPHAGSADSPDVRNLPRRSRRNSSAKPAACSRTSHGCLRLIRTHWQD